MFARDMHGGERRGARGVHCHARAREIQAVRNAICRDAVRAAGRRVCADSSTIGRTVLDSLIIIVRDAYEYADVRSFIEIQNNSGVLDGFPCGLEKEPLLRVDVSSLARRNSEKLRIKLVDALDETTALRD